MASSDSPLLERREKDEGSCEPLRKCTLLCHPMTLLLILVLCAVALVYPYWNNTNSFLSFSAHPFVETEHNSLHSLSTQYLSTEQSSDLVLSLPGLDSDSIDFNQYSGYVDALEGREIHYWFFEAQENADSAPLFFWTNGGPGCSGLCGLLTEHGPFWAVSEDTLLLNQYSWNNEVNIVYLEQPYGVGFSTVDEGLSAISGDQAAVADFDAAIRSFITKFPRFEEREIYLSSESFGGHYMPLTALQIMENNADATPYVNLKGFMVGNPYTNYYENVIGAMEAFYGHGLMRNDVYETWHETCYGDEEALSGTQCGYLYLFGYTEADNVDHYAVDFDLCINDISWHETKHKAKHMQRMNKLLSQTVNKLLNTLESDDEWDDFTEANVRPLFKKRNKKNGIKRKRNMKLLTRKDVMELKKKMNSKQEEAQRRRLNIEWAFEDTVYFACAADLMTQYLNQEAVQNALHVKTTDWNICNDEIWSAWPESDWDEQMQPYYAELVANYPELKILIYSGDDDSVCGLHGTQYWLDEMVESDEYEWNVDEDNEWVAWEHNNQLGGFSTTYLTADGDRALYFHTIRSAGHMVPQTQPSRALGLLRKFLYEME